MAGKFVIKRSGKDQDGFMFNLHASNGQVVLTSERYEAKASALNGIESVKTNAPDPARFELRQGSKEPYFVLKAGNGQVIGMGEHYSSDSAAREGMAAVTRAAEGAATDDQS
ncbi:YegP family protein [Deinococcus rubellus]|uniref:YegP family protein n=1 Tax=Deinococcus rubellus TaxID=1889240 RepID=A0ABY5YE32_9DEIO|nr:YegP family protein [Deinococcus rubellus]UWX63344.1 YegP family protein [Deinococcus rubellus]